MISKYTMAKQIMELCETIVSNSHSDLDGHLVIESALVLSKLRDIVNPPRIDADPIYTDTDSLKILMQPKRDNGGNEYE